MFDLQVRVLLITNEVNPNTFDIRNTGLTEVYLSVMCLVVSILPLTEALQHTAHLAMVSAALMCCLARRVENNFNIS
jgi:hypothetical protein